MRNLKVQENLTISTYLIHFSSSHAYRFNVAIDCLSLYMFTRVFFTDCVMCSLGFIFSHMHCSCVCVCVLDTYNCHYYVVELIIVPYYQCY